MSRSAPCPGRTRAAVAGLALLALVATGCGGEGDGTQSGGDPGAQHVHGLAYDPGREALVAAAHTGLFEIEGSRYTRIGENYQDTMAFTVAGPGRYLGSGHPGGEAQLDLPPFLGLIESTDGGESWSSVSLQGRVDFHLLQVAGSRIYGFGSNFKTRREALYVSDDGGKTWRIGPAPGALASLAVSPSDPNLLVASGARRLFLSRDGGRRWRPLRSGPGILAWPRDGALYRADPSGVLSVATAPTAKFGSLGDFGLTPTAFASAPDGSFYVAGEQDEILASGDNGRSWSEIAAP